MIRVPPGQEGPRLGAGRSACASCGGPRGSISLSLEAHAAGQRKQPCLLLVLLWESPRAASALVPAGCPDCSWAWPRPCLQGFPWGELQY